MCVRACVMQFLFGAIKSASLAATRTGVTKLASADFFEFRLNSEQP